MCKKLLWIIATMISLSLSQPVLADSGMCGKGIKDMISSLNLDSAQKDKIKPIMDQFKSNMQNMGTQMMSLKKQLHQQIVSPQMNQDTVNSLVDQKAKLIGDMMKAKISVKNQIFNILNDQQKAKLQTMMQNNEAKMEAKYKSCHDDD